MDENPNGEIVETPAGSQPGITTPEPNNEVNESASITSSPEEVAWNSLKGDTQRRITDILRERDQAKAESQRLNSFIQSPTFQTQSQTDLSKQNPQVRDAVQKLSDVGIATDEKVDALVNQRIGNLIYNFTLRDLSQKHDGSDGLPRFEQSEYQDFVQRNPKYQQYDPEDVYEKMYSQEIVDARARNYKGNGGQSSTPSLRPNKTTVREEQWTPESIEARMKESDGKDWYVANKQMVTKVLATQTPTAE